MSELVYNPKTMEWESAKTGETVSSEAKSYTRKSKKFTAPIVTIPKVEEPKEEPSDLLKSINFTLNTKGVRSGLDITNVEYEVEDYEDDRGRWGTLNNSGRYQGYVMRDGTLIVPDAMIEFISYRGAGRQNWKIGRRGYTTVTDNLLNDLMTHNEYEARNEVERNVRERNLNCIFILAELV
jgi:hypothetical protein